MGTSTEHNAQGCGRLYRNQCPCVGPPLQKLVPLSLAHLYRNQCPCVWPTFTETSAHSVGLPLQEDDLLHTSIPITGPAGQAVSRLYTAATSDLAQAAGPAGQAMSHLYTAVTGPAGQAVSRLYTAATSDLAPATGPAGQAVFPPLHASDVRPGPSSCTCGTSYVSPLHGSHWTCMTSCVPPLHGSHWTCMTSCVPPLHPSDVRPCPSNWTCGTSCGSSVAESLRGTAHFAMETNLPI